MFEDAINANKELPRLALDVISPTSWRRGNVLRKSLRDRDRRNEAISRGRFRRAILRKQVLAWRGGSTRVYAVEYRFQEESFEKLKAPIRISLQTEEARSELLQFLHRLRTKCLLEEVPIRIDFRGLESLQASAALLMAAEIDKIIRVKRMQPNPAALACNLPTMKLFRQVFHQLGLLDLLGRNTQSLCTDEYPEDVKHWRFATGCRVGKDEGDFLDAYEGRIAPSLAQGVWKALSEALVNSVQHAYLLDRGDGCPALKENRWWMLTEERDGQLTVAVCDLGIGIHRSLPMSWDSLTLGEIFNQINDKEAELASVRGALILGASRTGQTNRGRGLPQIWNNMKREDVGGILIMSGKAYLRYSAKESTEVGIQFADSILGTLIMWTVSIEDAVERHV